MPFIRWQPAQGGDPPRTSFANSSSVYRPVGGPDRVPPLRRQVLARRYWITVQGATWPRGTQRPIASTRQGRLGRASFARFIGPASGGGSPTAGTATVGRITNHSIAVSATTATGGTSPYSYQWQYRWLRGSSSWITATGAGVTTLTATVGNLGPAASYQIRLRVTDSASNVVYTNTITAYTLPLRWFPGLRSRAR